jgi:8-amino-7-oxononanoate synthase
MLPDHINKKITDYSDNGLIRDRYCISSRVENSIIINDNNLINFCSNDYLSLSNNKEINDAWCFGIDKYGFGSGSSASVSGYYTPHKLLEEKFAKFLNRDRAILFNSGYHANLGVTTTLLNRDGLAISDKLCHASMLDAINLSRAKHYRYRHNDSSHAESLLIRAQSKNKLLITEGVFSMEGSISPVNELSLIAKKYGAGILADDAHGIGILGKTGRGICEHYNLDQKDMPYLLVPLGKAICSMGAIVAGEKDFIDALRQFSRTYVYSTALPPSLAYATLKAISIVEEESWRLEKLRDLIELFLEYSKNSDLPLISDELTPIKSILIGDNDKVMKIHKKIMDKGFFISAIRPPTVPKNTARIRISINAAHEPKDIKNLTDLLAEFYHENT